MARPPCLRGISADALVTGAQGAEGTLQIVEALPGFAELALRSEALVVGKGLRGLLNEGMGVGDAGCGAPRRGGR